MLEPVRVVSLTRQFSCRGTKSPSLAPFFTHNRCDIGGMAMPAISIFTVTSYWSSLPCANATCATGSMHTPATAKRPRPHPTMLNRLAFIDLSLSGPDTTRQTAPCAGRGLTQYSIAPVRKDLRRFASLARDQAEATSRSASRRRCGGYAGRRMCAAHGGLVLQYACRSCEKLPTENPSIAPSAARLRAENKLM